MRDALGEILEKTDIVVASCRNVVSDEDLESFARAARNVRARLSFPPDLVVAVLAGGTGSGKSSIFNVIAGEEVSDVGGVRPTTSTPLAIVAFDRVGVIDGFLRELDIEVRPVAGVPTWLVLIDLPDIDSVEMDHRLQVEALLPRVDVIVWVSDPEKYRDAVFHDRFVKPLAAYASQMQFVLNQADRIPYGSVDEVLADFTSALREDGIDEPHPIATVADPTSGPPEGIEVLIAALETMTDAPQAVYSKLVIDLERAVAVLDTVVGGGGVNFDHRFGEVISDAAEMVVDDQGDAAVSALTRFVESLAIEAGGPVGDEIRLVAVAIPGAVVSASESLTKAMVEHRKALPRIRWSEKGDTMEREPKLAMASEQLVETLGPPLRKTLSRRADATAALADLSLSLTSRAAGRR